MNNNEYWGKRLADQLYKQNSDEMMKALAKIYKQQAKDIKASITSLFLSMLQDGEISTTKLYSYGRFTELLREINTILKNYGEKEVEVINKGLEDAYKNTFSKTTETLGKNVKWGLQNTYIMQEVVNANFKGTTWSERIWNNRNSLAKMLEKSIQNVVAAGMNKDTAIKEIMKAQNTSFSNADRLVRTETMRVINDGQIKSYINAGRTHGYYVFSDDDRNCEECERISNESRKNPLPLEKMEAVHHPRCRCTIRPVVNSNIKNNSSNKNDAFLIPATNNTKMNKNIERFSNILSNSKGEQSHVNKMQMYFEYTEFVEDTSRDIPFWYDVNNDDIRFNPNNEFFDYYDFNFAQCHEITHKMDINEYHSWENEDFMKAIEITSEKIYNDFENIEKLFLPGGKYELDIAVSDIISALTKGEMNTPFGHQKDYWKSSKKQALEIFANISSIDILDYENKEEFKGLFSEIYIAYRRIVNG